MTDRDYAIKSMKEITFQMASHAQDYLEVTIERHYTDIKELMTSYQCIFRKNRALAPHERSAVPLGTDHCPVG